VGGLRGFKNQVYEGGIRVPAVVEWPGKIAAGQTTDYPAVTMDIFPTIGALVGLDESAYLEPLDGVSLVPVLQGAKGPRTKPIPFRRIDGGAVIDNQWKILSPKLQTDKFELYDLGNDPFETTDLFNARPEVAARMMALWRAFDASRLSSIAGNDYPSRQVQPDPKGREDGVFWWELDAYQTYLENWQNRPEFSSSLKKYLKSSR
jgi:arylsulfatase A-like enzyme